MKIHISDLMENHNFCPPEHPQSSLPPELRLLHWENYPLQSFPQDFEGQHLVELNMPFSKLKKLWEGNKVTEHHFSNTSNKLVETMIFYEFL